MSPAQLPLDFPVRAAQEREDFLVADSNEDAVAWIDCWPGWSGRMLLLVGPAGSGKSHLAAVWRRMSGAENVSLADLARGGIDALIRHAGRPLLLEDLDREIMTSDEEETLFHLFNLLREGEGSLLMTARQAPVGWALKLADLRSRLGTVAIARIEEPCDGLFAALLIKHFSDRQLAVPPEVVQYIITRLERSFAAAERFVARLDRHALAGKRKITLALVRDLLKEEGE